MNLSYKNLLDPDFDQSSRVWIYQSNRVFSIQEALQLELMLQEFVGSWKSHGSPVKGAAYLFFGQFIILMADESSTSVGGCSTDSSVRFIKNIETSFSASLFDRTMLAFIVNEKIQLLPLAQLNYSYTNGFIGPETLYFNNIVQTKGELENNWIIPVKDSWLARKLPSVTEANL